MLGKSEAGEIPENMQIIRKKRQGADCRIAVRNAFSGSLMDVMFSEIFFMQVCEYLNSKMHAADIHYEKLKIDRENSFFIITIRGIEESVNKSFFPEDSIEISRL